MCSPILQDADLSLRDRGWQHSKEVRHSFFIMSVYVPSAKVCDRPSWSQCGKRPYKVMDAKSHDSLGLTHETTYHRDLWRERTVNA